MNDIRVGGRVLWRDQHELQHDLQGLRCSQDMDDTVNSNEADEENHLVRNCLYYWYCWDTRISRLAYDLCLVVISELS